MTNNLATRWSFLRCLGGGFWIWLWRIFEIMPSGARGGLLLPLGLGFVGIWISFVVGLSWGLVVRVLEGFVS